VRLAVHPASPNDDRRSRTRRLQPYPPRTQEEPGFASTSAPARSLIRT
jgi:hypothetical protein